MTLVRLVTIHPLEYFSGSKGHNTVEIDDRAQMPKISRFLLVITNADNIQKISQSEDITSFSAGYIDYKKAQHIRSIQLKDRKILVTDELKRFIQKQFFGGV